MLICNSSQEIARPHRRSNSPLLIRIDAASAAAAITVHSAYAVAAAADRFTVVVVAAAMDSDL